MRVLQVHASYAQRGGEDMCVEAEARALSEAGHEVRLLGRQNPVDPGPIASVGTLLTAPWNPRETRRVRRLVAEWRPDVAHVHNTWPSLSPAVLAALDRAGIPIVSTAHNYRIACANGLLFRDGRPCTDCVGRTPLPGVQHRCFRGSLPGSAAAAATILAQRRLGLDSRIHAHVAPSETARRLLVDAGVDPGSVIVVPHAIPDPGVRQSPPSESEIVLYAGRLSEEKGIRQLLDGWRRLGPQSDLQLWVAGDGPLRGEVETTLAAGAERSSGIRLLGWRAREEILELQKLARAVVFPSQCYETFGLGVSEALACGTPVVVAAGGAPAELALAGGAGKAVAEAEEPRSWSAALRELQTAEWLDSCGANGRDYYESELTTARVRPRIESVYRAAISAAR